MENKSTMKLLTITLYTITFWTCLNPTYHEDSVPKPYRDFNYISLKFKKV